MKRLICVLVVLVMVFAQFSVVAYAQETEENKKERVFNELLTGNITNVDDVLDVAFEQMESMGQFEETATYGMRSVSNDSSLQVMQVVEASEDEDGGIEGLMAVTGLLLTDENGRSVSADEYREYRMNTTNTEGSLSQYSIRATHTIYIKLWNTSSEFNGNSSYKLEYMRLRLYYDSTYMASAIRQRYADQADSAGYDTKYEEQSWIYSPTAGTYKFTPSKSRQLALGGYACIQGSADIVYGSEKMTVGTVLPTSFLQDKIDNGTLIEGW